MLRSLVGSEMCIRDSSSSRPAGHRPRAPIPCLSRRYCWTASQYDDQSWYRCGRCCVVVGARLLFCFVCCCCWFPWVRVSPGIATRPLSAGSGLVGLLSVVVFVVVVSRLVEEEEEEVVRWSLLVGRSVVLKLLDASECPRRRRVGRVCMSPREARSLFSFDGDVTFRRTPL